MKQYHTYIFDLDGTITDTMAVWLKLLHDNLLEFGVTPPDDKTILSHAHDWNTMIEFGLREDQLNAFSARASTLANELLPAAHLHVGSYAMLERLKNRGKRIGIYSAMKRDILEPAMHYRNLSPLVEVAISGSDVPRRKPHPDGIYKALEDLSVSEDEYKNAIYIGDRETDIQAAHNAGIDAALYYPASHQLMYSLKELKKYNPEYILTDWHELLP